MAAVGSLGGLVVTSPSLREPLPSPATIPVSMVAAGSFREFTPSLGVSMSAEASLVEASKELTPGSLLLDEGKFESAVGEATFCGTVTAC